MNKKGLTTDISHLKQIFAGDKTNNNYKFIYNVVDHLESGDKWWSGTVSRANVDYVTALTSKMYLIENLYRKNYRKIKASKEFYKIFF